MSRALTTFVILAGAIVLWAAVILLGYSIGTHLSAAWVASTKGGLP